MTSEFLEEGDHYRIERRGRAVRMTLRGRYGDAGAAEWVDVLTRAVRSAALPPEIAVVDSSSAQPETSLATRMNSARLLNALLSPLDRVAVYLGESATSAFVGRVVFRAAELDNVEFVTTQLEFERLLESIGFSH